MAAGRVIEAEPRTENHWFRTPQTGPSGAFVCLGRVTVKPE